MSHGGPAEAASLLEVQVEVDAGGAVEAAAVGIRGGLEGYRSASPEPESDPVTTTSSPAQPGGGGGGGGAPSNTECRRMFGEPEPGLPTTPGVPLATMASRTCCGDADGFAARYSAATPATCGVAMDVPLIVLEAASEPIHADVMPTPGANQSRHVPKLEKLARASF